MQQVRQVRNRMSDRDRRLYNFAKIKIAEEDLDDCEITVDFEDQEALVLCAVNNPSGRLYMGYDGGYYPKMVWRRRGLWRNFKRFWVGCFRTLKGALLHGLQFALKAAPAFLSIDYK